MALHRRCGKRKAADTRKRVSPCGPEVSYTLRAQGMLCILTAAFQVGTLRHTGKVASQGHSES